MTTDTFFVRMKRCCLAFLILLFIQVFSFAQANSTSCENISGIIGCCLHDRSGTTWFGANGNGIYRYDGDSLFHYTEEEGLNSLMVYCILQDKRGIIWLGTEMGICRYDGKRFTSFPVPGISSGINHSLVAMLADHENKSLHCPVYCLLEDKAGAIWIGSNKGLSCYNGKYFTHYICTDGTWKNIPGNSLINLAYADQVNDNDGTAITNVLQIVEDDKSNVWLSTLTQKNSPGYVLINGQHPGLYRYDGRTFTSFF